MGKGMCVNLCVCGVCVCVRARVRVCGDQWLVSLSGIHRFKEVQKT